MHGRQTSREGRDSGDRGEGSSRDRLQPSELDVLRTPLQRQGRLPEEAAENRRPHQPEGEDHAERSSRETSQSQELDILRAPRHQQSPEIQRREGQHISAIEIRAVGADGSVSRINEDVIISRVRRGGPEDAIRLVETVIRRTEQFGSDSPGRRITIGLMLYHAERYRAESSQRQPQQEVPPRREANPARERENPETQRRERQHISAIEIRAVGANGSVSHINEDEIISRVRRGGPEDAIRLVETVIRRTEQFGSDSPGRRITIGLMLYHAERYRAESSQRQPQQEVPPRREANPAREREPWENIVQTGAWSSEAVQRSLTRLRGEEPGTSEWNMQAADLLFEYQEQLEKINTERVEKGEPALNWVAHLDTISDALIANGSIYEAVVRERSLSASPQSE